MEVERATIAEGGALLEGLPPQKRYSRRDALRPYEGGAPDGSPYIEDVGGVIGTLYRRPLWCRHFQNADFTATRIKSTFFHHAADSADRKAGLSLNMPRAAFLHRRHGRDQLGAMTHDDTDAVNFF